MSSDSGQSAVTEPCCQNTLNELVVLPQGITQHQQTLAKMMGEIVFHQEENEKLEMHLMLSLEEVCLESIADLTNGMFTLWEVFPDLNLDQMCSEIQYWQTNLYYHSLLHLQQLKKELYTTGVVQTLGISMSCAVHDVLKAECYYCIETALLANSLKPLEERIVKSASCWAKREPEERAKLVDVKSQLSLSQTKNIWITHERMSLQEDTKIHLKILYTMVTALVAMYRAKIGMTPPTTDTPAIIASASTTIESTPQTIATTMNQPKKPMKKAGSKRKGTALVQRQLFPMTPAIEPSSDSTNSDEEQSEEECQGTINLLKEIRYQYSRARKLRRERLEEKRKYTDAYAKLADDIDFLINWSHNEQELIYQTYCLYDSTSNCINMYSDLNTILDEMRDRLSEIIPF